MINDHHPLKIRKLATGMDLGKPQKKSSFLLGLVAMGTFFFRKRILTEKYLG